MPVLKLKLPKYVTRDTGPDGKERFYYRRPGAKKIRINGVPWTPPFMAEYNTAAGGPDVVVAQPIVRKTGTFSWLCDQYFLSGEFRELDEKLTKPRRRNNLLRICREPIAPNSTRRFGDVPLVSWNKKAIRALRDRVADKPGTASDWLKALRAIFKFAVEADHCEANPTREVQFLRSNNVDGHHSWTIEEVEKFESKYQIGSEERLAMGLLIYTGQRMSDVIRFGPASIKDGWLHFTQHKNRKRKPVHMQIPVRPELLELLKATPTGTETFLVNTFGRPHKDRGFSEWFGAACEAAGVPGRSHGLRKAAAARLAELGASEKEIMSITGHTTSQEVTRYTKAASQKLLAEKATALSAKKGAA